MTKKQPTNTPVQASLSGARLGPQNYALVGSQGVALTLYALRKIGIHAMEAGEGLHFDVLAIHGPRTLRIQSKATQACDDKGRYNFIIARGRYAPKGSHSAPLTNYKASEVDIIALSALPIDKVLFVPIGSADKAKISIHEEKFWTPDAARTTFTDCLSKIARV